MNLRPPVTLTLNNAAAKEHGFGQIRGYGFVFVGQEDSTSNANSGRGDRNVFAISVVGFQKKIMQKPLIQFCWPLD